ncbi:hypothetical protein PMAYCL1PPCAC_25904, partial [Pristionchus mayeri]
RRFLVRCRGFPFSVTENEVSEFLGGKGIKSIELTHRPSGQAIIECEDEESFNAALSKNRQHIRDRCVAVSQSSASDMAEAEKAKGGEPSLGTNEGVVADAGKFFVQCSGLPFNAKENEISEFLGGKGVKRIKFMPILPTGNAIVECED